MIHRGLFLPIVPQVGHCLRVRFALCSQFFIFVPQRLRRSIVSSCAIPAAMNWGHDDYRLGAGLGHVDPEGFPVEIDFRQDDQIVSGLNAVYRQRPGWSGASQFT